MRIVFPSSLDLTSIFSNELQKYCLVGELKQAGIPSSSLLPDVAANSSRGCPSLFCFLPVVFSGSRVPPKFECSKLIEKKRRTLRAFLYKRNIFIKRREIRHCDCGGMEWGGVEWGENE